MYIKSKTKGEINYDFCDNEEIVLDMKSMGLIFKEHLDFVPLRSLKKIFMINNFYDVKLLNEFLELNNIIVKDDIKSDTLNKLTEVDTLLLNSVNKFDTISKLNKENIIISYILYTLKKRRSPKFIGNIYKELSNYNIKTNIYNLHKIIDRSNKLKWAKLDKKSFELLLRTISKFEDERVLNLIKDNHKLSHIIINKNRNIGRISLIELDIN